MNLAKPAAVSAAVVAAMLAASAWAWPHTPPELPTHWGVDGAPDRWSPRGWALLVDPIAALLLTGLFAVLPGIMPRNARLDRSAGAYGTVWLAVVAILALAHGVAIASALGVPVQPIRVLGAGVGAGLMLVGNLAGKMRRNYVMGVRTPWTLADERVWDRTHRVVGPWIMVWGAAVLLAALLGGGAASLAVALAGAATVVVGSVTYSYLVARRLGAA